jgi:hypothetical protein
MEYPGETTQDFLGIGSWDFAATRLFYGDVTDVLMDPTFAEGTARYAGVLSKLNGGFGGLLGFSYEPAKGAASIHYSQLNDHYELIKDCKAVENINAFKPANWDVSRDGEWHPTLDGLIVSPTGDAKYTRCKQQKVDYVPWTSLQAYSGEIGGGKPEYNRNALTPKDKWGSSYWGANDAQGRPLVGYGFATDRWADLGNSAVYRHDNGADTFEIFNFLMTQREVNHVWDAYRRDRAAFSVRSYMGRILGRYNEKIRDGAKGLGLYRNMTEDFAIRRGENPDTTWQMLIGSDGFGQVMREPIIAAGMAFDHFVRELTRPQSGPYQRDKQKLPEGDWLADPEGLLYSAADMGLSGSVEKSEYGNPRAYYLMVPDGPFVSENSGHKAFDVFSPGGALVENQLAEGQGDYDAEYTMTAGSYYNKFTVGYLMSESADNFISDSLMDFTDPRYRAVALAHLFPEGYRRLLGNMLTNDTFMKGPRVACDATGEPYRVAKVEDVPRYINKPLGWVSWWGETPRVCFPGGPSPVCDGLYNGGDFDMSDSYPKMKTLDPQVGWEQQKWLMLDTAIFIGDNEKGDWYDMMRVEYLNANNEKFINRIELHDPNSSVFVARTFGREEIFGRTVQKGVGARVLEYANSLINRAYTNTPVDHDSDGVVDWYLPTLGTDGKARIKHDPSMTRGAAVPPDWGPCSASNNSGCRCEDNVACLELRKYISVVKLMGVFPALRFITQPKGVY